VFLCLGFPLLVSLLAGCLVLTALLWAATESDAVAAKRQQDLVNLIVSKLQSGVAHDQESATVWDDAVVKTAEADGEWMEINLGNWMNSYFGHDALFVLHPKGKPFYHYLADTAGATELTQYQDAYAPLAARLRARLLAGDDTGVTDKVLTIGESDLAVVGDRPAIVSVKPIVSDTGEIAQDAGSENLHVAVRFLDGSLTAMTGAEYQLADLHFSWMPSREEGHAQVPLTARNGAVIGYLTWQPFQPGTTVLKATVPAMVVAMVVVFAAFVALGSLLLRRSARLAASRDELQHLAHHDTLTGLLNRAGFGATLSKRLSASSVDEPHAVLFLDLDRFKQVNDTFGHPVGDQLIVQVAERLRRALGPVAIGRIGGDEFTVLLQDATEQQVATICEDLVTTLGEPFELDDTLVQIGASVGAVLVTGSADATEIVRRADIALYHAKAAGRGRFAIFGKHMDEVLQARRELERDLRAAVQHRVQIETVYQPVYDAVSQKLSGVEALARWRHPQKGVIGPDVFIPLAEELGLIQPLGQIVLRNACETVARYGDLKLAINASLLELHAASYPIHILSTLAQFQIDPQRLEIEITESLQLDGSRISERAIAVLRQAGVRFAIDDFGAGYSSFGRLQDLHVDRIKIDKSFIDALGQTGSGAVVEAMISMAHAKGLQTTAEGVETEEQSTLLRLAGCDQLQGYLLSRPLPGEALHRLLGGEAVAAVA
jgi:diguanylate cyclase (GGDEF)-like protein